MGVREACMGPGRQGLHAHSSPVTALSRNEFPSPFLVGAPPVRPPASEQGLEATPNPGTCLGGKPRAWWLRPCLPLFIQPHSRKPDNRSGTQE